MRAGVEFPNLPPEVLTQLKEAGPSPEGLDATKQLVLYSDCFVSPDGVAVHLPRNLDWKEECEHRLAEAVALVSYLRDYPPEEVEVRAKYGAIVREQGRSFAEVMKPLYQELVEKGFVTAQQWAPIWEYLGKVTG
jgi:hypothetical protein